MLILNDNCIILTLKNLTIKAIPHLLVETENSSLYLKELLLFTNRRSTLVGLSYSINKLFEINF